MGGQCRRAKKAPIECTNDAVIVAGLTLDMPLTLNDAPAVTVAGGCSEITIA
jgi:hypothetical protein